jgi:hypothetical protein
VDPVSLTIFNYFESRNWQVSWHESLPIARIDYTGTSGSWTLYVRARDEAEQVIVLSVHPDTVPEGRRPAMAEFLTRANFGLNIGNFEMDFDDGEVRFRTSIDVEGSALDDSLLNTLVVVNVGVMDDYLPGITAVLKGEREPSDAIRLCEGD